MRYSIPSVIPPDPVDPESEVPCPRQAHIAYLYSITNQADQKPGRDWYERYDVLKKELDALKAEAARVVGMSAQ